MPKPRRDPAEIAALVEQRVEQGLDLVDSFLFATGRGSHKSGRALANEHRKAVAQQEREQRAHAARRSSLRSQEVGGAIVTGVAGSVGVIDAITTAAGGGIAGPAPLWFVAAGIGLIVAVRGRRRLRRMGPAPEAVALVAPPPRLRRGAIGAAEVARFSSVRVQIMTMAPSLDRLHPGAGDELRRADLEAAGPLTSLCERLAVLDDLQRELPGTTAAATAATSAGEVRDRLAAGCATYDDLLSAAAELLAAPDLGRRTSDVLDPAVTAMLAYAHGLRRASDL